MLVAHCRNVFDFCLTTFYDLKRMTGKETYGTNASKCSQEDIVLKSLVDAFGSKFSLEEIASAYFKAGYKADLAGEILFQMQESTSSSALSDDVGNGDNLGKGKVSEKKYQVKGNLKAAKSKVQSFSTGTVSNIIGKEYACSKPSGNKFTKVNKPVKVEVKVLHESSSEGDCTSLPSDFDLHHEMEDFLFKMLGDGFRLKREVIREVIGRFLSLSLPVIFNLILTSDNTLEFYIYCIVCSLLNTLKICVHEDC